jgi:HK97 gp10 family phage protein
MANAITINIKGLEDLKRKLQKELPERAEAYARAAIKDGAKLVETQMKADCPEYKGDLWNIPPGFLRNSISTVTNEMASKMGADEFHSWTGPAAKLLYPKRFVETHYKKLKGASKRLKNAKIVERIGMLVLQVARLMEHGTHGHPPHAFIRTALGKVGGHVIDAMAKRLKSGLIDKTY